MDTPTDVAGTEVTLLDANHCPGAAIFHFKLQDGTRYLHTGDFRASAALASHPLSARVHVLYLDTTYCDPRYCFPEQYKTINVIADRTKQILRLHPATLVVVGTYSIGQPITHYNMARGFKMALGSSKWL